jgi:hypothetical protein
MNAKSNLTKYILIIVSWVIFVGLCIDAGGFLTNTIYTLFFNPELARKFWSHLDLSALHQFSVSHFAILTCIMSIAAIMKSILFYLITRMFYEKKLDILKPFSEKSKQFIQIAGYISLGIGLVSSWGADMVEKMLNEGVSIPTIQNLKIDGANVWLFVGVILLVIAHVFTRGIELQNENDLTI